MKIHTAVVSHRHGYTFFASHTEDGIYTEVMDFCCLWWTEAFPEEDGPAEGLSSRDIVAKYFEFGRDESVDFGTAELEDIKPALSS